MLHVLPQPLNRLGQGSLASFLTELVDRYRIQPTTDLSTAPWSETTCGEDAWATLLYDQASARPCVDPTYISRQLQPHAASLKSQIKKSPGIDRSGRKSTS